MDRHIYVITKEGRILNPAGKNYVINNILPNIEEEYSSFREGSKYNNPAYLAGELTPNDCLIIYKRYNGSASFNVIFKKKSVKHAIKQLLTASDDKTSWEILSDTNSQSL